MLRAPWPITVALSVVACADYDGASPRGGPSDARGPDGDVAEAPLRTWHADARPIFERRCVRCHWADGVGPMPLDDFASVSANLQLIADKLTAGEMPPWPLAGSCRPLAVEHALTSAESAILREWGESGYPEGDPATYVPRAPDAPFDSFGDEEVTLGAVSYQPVEDGARCFLLAPAERPDARGWWASDFVIRPGATRVVQQATLYLVSDPQDAVGAEASGHACPFGAGAPSEVAVAAWVPGARPTSYPQGAALFVPEGARFVLRVRYRVSRLTGTPHIQATDTTTATLWRYAGRPPGDTQVRVHAVGASEAATALVPWSETIIGLIPEMSPGGRSLGIEYGEGAGSTCLARSERWADFEETQLFAAGEAPDVELGRPLRLACGYADGATARACRVHLIATAPLFDSPLVAPGSACNGLDRCVAACRDTSSCLLDCLAWEAPACGDCARAQLFERCAGTLVDPQDAVLRGHLEDLAACEAQCPATLPYAAWLSCMLADEACATRLYIAAAALVSDWQVGSATCADDALCLDLGGSP